MELKELRVYNQSMELGEKVWNIVLKWDYFAKDTVGKQLVKSIDSVAANLSEGFGRYFYREKIHFGHYSRGSLYEAKTWLTKAYNRKLILEEEFKFFTKEITDLGVKLNNYLSVIKNKTDEINN